MLQNRRLLGNDHLNRSDQGWGNPQGNWCTRDQQQWGFITPHCARRGTMRNQGYQSAGRTSLRGGHGGSHSLWEMQHLPESEAEAECEQEREAERDLFLFPPAIHHWPHPIRSQVAKGEVETGRWCRWGLPPRAQKGAEKGKEWVEWGRD